MSHETDLLRDVARDLLTAALDPQAIESAEQRGGLPPLWSTLTELEWPMIGVAASADEEADALEQLSAVLEAVGRHAAPVPLLETGLVRWALGSERGASVEPGAVLTVAPARAGERLPLKRRGEDVVVSGTAERVPWAADARAILVYADEGEAETAVLVPRDSAGLQIAAGRNLAGEPRDEVTFCDVVCPARAVVRPAPSREQVMLRMAFARSAATLGAIGAVYEITREHVTTRRQFDRPLVRLKVVGADLARMAIERSLARVALEAAVAAHAGGEDVVWSTAAAKLAGARAATTVSRLAHQLHGAIGMTREHRLQLWTRRLWSWRDEGGTEDEWEAMLGGAVQAAGEEALWAFVAR
jgi:alkylation response protein AidB-like acyl-CoA dehydrogenase